MKAFVEKSIVDADEFIDEDYIKIPFVVKNVGNKLDIVAYSDKNLLMFGLNLTLMLNFLKSLINYR